MVLRLYTYHRNSAGQRVRIALAIKGLAYETVSAPGMGRAAYLQVNPQGLMPALEVDGVVVAQSMAILEYLEETCPDPPLLPADRLLRARVRSFAHLVAADIHPLNNHRVRHWLEHNMGATEPQVLAWYRHWVATGLASLEAIAAAEPPAPRFLFGDTPGLAELCLVPQLHNARRFGCDLSAYPRLVEVDARCRALPAFQAALPPAVPQ
jgi:maleylacetoacetate isomerase